jgi:uncharacterized protein with HEPN domain
MSRHDPLVRLRHMLDFSEQAIRLMGGRSREEFVSNELLLLGEARLVEMIGEAANCVLRETQEGLPDVPWVDVIGMRHRLIHGYDTSSVDKIYDVVIQDLPVLVHSLQEYLSSHS